MTDILVVTNTSTRAELEAAIQALRTKAKRYSLNDRRRLEIDDECDALVDQWMLAGT